jgi:hypothetical protein
MQEQKVLRLFLIHILIATQYSALSGLLEIIGISLSYYTYNKISIL